MKHDKIIILGVFAFTLMGCTTVSDNFDPNNAREIKLWGKNSYSMDNSSKSGWEFEVESVQMGSKQIFSPSFLNPASNLDIGPGVYTVKVKCYFNNVAAAKKLYPRSKIHSVDLSVNEAVTFKIQTTRGGSCNTSPKYRAY